MLILKSELSRVLGVSLDDLMSDNRIEWVLRQQDPTDDMIPNLEMLGAEGIGFGMAFPDATEQMYRGTYEEVDLQKWEQYHNAGLDIPKHPDLYPLEQRETESLSIVAEYVHEFWPELEHEFELSHLLS